ncbi:MAG: dipeptide/oligopeptide/nickel ABC transporter ATP-binding protein [Planctomycetota bacterium]
MSEEDLLGAEDLSVHYPAAPSRAVEGVNIALHAGETLALVGASGSGKSSLARALLLLEPAARGRVWQGAHLLFDSATKKTLSRREERGFRRRFQFVFQEPLASLSPRMRVGELVVEGLVIHGLARGAQLRSRLGELLGLVGLDADIGQRYPHEFSGGQRQRIALARALAVEPELMVLDEPTSSLDAVAAAEIVQLLAHLNQKLGLAYLLVSHDPELVERFSDRVAVMQSGKIVEVAATADLYDAPEHPYTKSWLNAAAARDAAPRASSPKGSPHG